MKKDISSKLPRPLASLRKIPVLDISGLGAFQVLHGNQPEMEINGTRIALLFEANDLFYELSGRYNRNESVPVLDFAAAQRQLRARMMAMKGDRK